MTKNSLSEKDDDLLQRYLSGIISTAELESLEQLLRSNPEARSRLRSYATIDTKWQQLAMDRDATQGGDPWSEIQSGPKTSVERKRSTTGWTIVAVIAASLALATFGWFFSNDESVIRTGTGIARVIRVEGEVSDEYAAELKKGSELYAGELLSMSSGLVELAFRNSGVHVIATAPLRARLDNDKRMTLLNGQVKLVVPPQGIGFVVDTEQRRFIDLGTSFVVTANSVGSEVLVLDGKISVASNDYEPASFMHEGEFAKFDQNGRTKKRTASRASLALPGLKSPATEVTTKSLSGLMIGYPTSSRLNKSMLSKDRIGSDLLPLIQSGFRDTTCLEPLKKSRPISFRGIAGAYHDFPRRSELEPYHESGGWLSWYHGEVLPPVAGRYRFWGYADNHLLVAVDGKPVFEGSRHDSSFKNLGIARTDNPALPCLIASAGFACSDWIDVTTDPVQIDILFGEVGGRLTSGLLLIEREGEQYEETFWGQPKWPLFLTEAPQDSELPELNNLLQHLEEKTMGSFSIANDAIWKVNTSTPSSTIE